MTMSGSAICATLIVGFGACTAELRTTTPVLENVVIMGPVRRCNGAVECCDSPGRWDNVRGR